MEHNHKKDQMEEEFFGDSIGVETGDIPHGVVQYQIKGIKNPYVKILKNNHFRTKKSVNEEKHRMIKYRHKGLHESTMEAINERAEMNVKKIEWMELNELLSALKETIEYDINSDLDFFRVVLGVEDGKAFIDIESKDTDEVSFFDGFGVDDIIGPDLDITGYGLDEAEVDKLRQQILSEQDKIENRIIPKIARQWGFRKIKEAINEDTVKQGSYWVNKGKDGTHGKFKTKKAADSQRRAMFSRGYKESCETTELIDEGRHPEEVPTVDDLIQVNLLNKGWPTTSAWFLLRDTPPTKYLNTRGQPVNSQYYRESQIKTDGDANNYIIKLSVLDKEDADKAEVIAKKLGLQSKFIDDSLPMRGYKYVYGIYIPQGLVDEPAAVLLKQNNVSPDFFKRPIRVENHIKAGK